MNLFLLNSGKCDAAFNMALDEALLEAVSRIGKPVLRFYGWTEPAATFGYFQKYADVERATPLRPLIRRPTGGGIVPHDADWTYSVVFPPGHEWHLLKAEESYRRIHDWLRLAFAEMKVETELAPCCRKAESGKQKTEIPCACFAGHEKSDLLGAAKKSPARPSDGTGWVCSFKARSNHRRFRCSARTGRKRCARWRQRVFR